MAESKGKPVESMSYEAWFRLEPDAKEKYALRYEFPPDGCPPNPLLARPERGADIRIPWGTTVYPEKED